jgi:hypothetical protein
MSFEGEGITVVLLGQKGRDELTLKGLPLWRQLQVEVRFN